VATPAPCKPQVVTESWAVLGRQFEGGVVVISHDSQLLSVVCDDEERAQARPRAHDLKPRRLLINRSNI